MALRGTAASTIATSDVYRSGMEFSGWTGNRRQLPRSRELLLRFDLERADQVEEDAVVVVAQVRQVVREVREVVADPDLEVVSQVPV